MFVFEVAIWSSTPANDGKHPGDFDSQAEMSVRVWKGDFIIETLWHYNLCPKVLFEIMWSHIYIYMKSNSSWRTAGVNISNVVAVFPGVSQKGKFNHDDEYGHGQEKRRLSTYVEGNMWIFLYIYISSLVGSHNIYIYIYILMFGEASKYILLYTRIYMYIYIYKYTNR